MSIKALNTKRGSTSIATLSEQNPNEAAKLLKILNLALAGTAGEAEAALAHAMRLASKHDLDFSTLTEAELEKWNRDRITDPIITVRIKVAKGDYRRPPSFKYVCRIIDKYFNVFTVTHGSSTVTMVGKTGDVTRAEYVMFFLFKAFNKLWREYSYETGTDTSHRDTYFRGIWVGFSRKLSKELSDAKEEAFANADTEEVRREYESRYALTITSHQEALKSAAEEQIGKIVYTSSPVKPVRNWDAYEDGMEKGSQLTVTEGLKNRGGGLSNKNSIG